MPGKMPRPRREETLRRSPRADSPFAASIENLLSGVEGEDDFVLEGPAAGAKGARARNMIATQPLAASAAKTHDEIGPRGSAAHWVGTVFH
jgi:hypothetical protein